MKKRVSIASLLPFITLGSPWVGYKFWKTASMFSSNGQALYSQHLAKCQVFSRCSKICLPQRDEQEEDGWKEGWMSEWRMDKYVNE